MPVGGAGRPKRNRSQEKVFKPLEVAPSVRRSPASVDVAVAQILFASCRCRDHVRAELLLAFVL